MKKLLLGAAAVGVFVAGSVPASAVPVAHSTAGAGEFIACNGQPWTRGARLDLTGAPGRVVWGGEDLLTAGLHLTVVIDSEGCDTFGTWDPATARIEDLDVWGDVVGSDGTRYSLWPLNGDADFLTADGATLDGGGDIGLCRYVADTFEPADCLTGLDVAFDAAYAAGASAGTFTVAGDGTPFDSDGR